MSPANNAAWIKEAGKPLVVETAPYPEPAENEIVVKTAAVSVNPLEARIVATGAFVKQFPAVIGTDIAGTVVAVGSAVTAFKPGDRVMGSSQAIMKGSARLGTFQEYVVVLPPTVCHIPDSLKETDAVVLPLTIDTASAMLFQKEHLALPMPPTAEGKGKAVLVWGGSTGVGSSATQLLKAAGYDVVVTAGPKNFDYCKSLGATTVLDYNSANIEQELLDATKGKTVDGGIICVRGDEAHKVICRVLAKSEGKKVASSVVPGAKDLAVDGVKLDNVFATTVAFNEVGSHIWTKFLPEALKSGAIVAKPEAVIVGKGLDAIQQGVARYSQGVSAQKVVVEI